MLLFTLKCLCSSTVEGGLDFLFDQHEGRFP